MRLIYKSIKILTYILLICILLFWAVLPEGIPQIFKWMSGENVDKAGEKQEKERDATGKNIENDAMNLESNDGSGNSSDVNNPQEDSNTEQSVENKNSYFLTLEEIMEIQNISLEDKVAGIKILSRLSRADIETIADYSNDGITLGEANEIKAILSKKLDERELECLNEIILRNKRLFSERSIEKK